MCNSLPCMGIYSINFINDFSSSSSATMPSLAINRGIVPICRAGTETGFIWIADNDSEFYPYKHL